MFDLWTEEPSEEEVEEVIAKVADKIKKRRLEVPAVIALEMHKPLAYVGSHAALGMSPFLVPLFGFDAVNTYSRVFSKRENVERLLRKIEETPETAPTETQ